MFKPFQATQKTFPVYFAILDNINLDKMVEYGFLEALIYPLLLLAVSLRYYGKQYQAKPFRKSLMNHFAEDGTFFDRNYLR